MKLGTYSHHHIIDVAILLILGLVAGCAAPVEPVRADLTVYHADLAFTLDERLAIWQAAWHLSEITGHPFTIIFDGELSADYTIVRHEDGGGGCNDIQAHTQHLHIGMLATGFRPELSSAAEDVATIVAHELTHGLGMMDHVQDPDSLMSPVWTPGGFRWTAFDQAYCEAAGVCKPSTKAGS